MHDKIIDFPKFSHICSIKIMQPSFCKFQFWSLYTFIVMEKRWYTVSQQVNGATRG